MRLHESDGDWHIELTDAATTPVTSCIIAEIPAETYGVIYRRARGALAALVDTTKLSPSGDVDPPLRVQLTGAAFYDGYHQKQIGRHTSELQSPCNLVCRLLLEKKKQP